MPANTQTPRFRGKDRQTRTPRFVPPNPFGCFKVYHSTRKTAAQQKTSRPHHPCVARPTPSRIPSSSPPGEPTENRTHAGSAAAEYTARAHFWYDTWRDWNACVHACVKCSREGRRAETEARPPAASLGRLSIENTGEIPTEQPRPTPTPFPLRPSTPRAGTTPSPCCCFKSDMV